MYGASGTAIKNFPSLRTAVLWAGVLGVIQSVIWIGLTITSILAYCCILYIAPELNFGTMIKYVFFKVYFHRTTAKMPLDYYQNFNYTFLDKVDTVFDPTQLLIWDSVYLGVAVCWFIVSIALFLFVRKDNVKQTLSAIYTWAFFILVICAMDVTAGVIFGVDFGRFHAAALKWNANDINTGEVDPLASTLMAAGVAAIAMMIISFKGFILWFINFGLLIYLLIRAVRIATDKDGTDTLFNPRKDSNDILTTRPPIRAYEEEERVEIRGGYNNDVFVPDRSSTAETIEVNEEAIVRAAHLSRDANLLDRRFRNIDAFHQYPAPKNQPPARQASQAPVQQETILVATNGYPMPDYSPQLSPNGNLRHHQYQ
ncbi:LOW QUALITY PROTEIN: uncharacterized protein [Drosophila tropicalis]|uniref:LOW QUALITY PROTEIN: uncharacterized protein n=1 Tax=Drosophila tropicalis TaxID=46794 RepID=UPI0035ABA772